MSTHAEGANQKSWDRVIYGGATTAAIQAALNAVDAVLLKGNFTLTAMLDVVTDQRLGIRGVLTKGFNGDMIHNATHATHDDNIQIVGEPYGILLGEGATYTGRGILLENNAQATAAHDVIAVRNLKIIDTQDHPIEILEHGHDHIYKVQNCVLRGNDAAAPLGLMLNSASDWTIEDCLPINNGCQLYAGASGLFARNYVNTGLYVYGSMRGTTFLGNRIDSDGVDGALCQGMYDCAWTGNVIWSSGDGVEVIDGIKMQDDGANHCHDNTFTGNRIFRGGGTRQFVYGIEEVDVNQDYNCYTGNNSRDSATGAIRRLGANSKPTNANNHDNQGTIIEA